MSSPPVDPSVAAGGGPPPDSTDPQGRRPPSRSADPGQSSAGGFRDEGGPGDPQPQPKGRDDDQLEAALSERLRGFGDIDVSDVQVAVDDGRVTLTGRVADGAARSMIESRVAEVLGVTAVDNRIGTRGS
jgi:hypothetical protein